jgi:TonB family protein
MKRILSHFFKIVLLGTLVTQAAVADSSTQKSQPEDTCPEPIYKQKELSRAAKILSRANPQGDGRTTGTIIATAVLCRTGKVTDISIKFGLTDEMNKRVIEAVRQTRFTPAEKDGQPASQRVRFEYSFSVF